MTNKIKNSSFKVYAIIASCFIANTMFDISTLAPQMNQLVMLLTNSNPFLIALAFNYRKLSRIVIDMPMSSIVDKKLNASIAVTISFVFKFLFFFVVFNATSIGGLLLAITLETLSLCLFRGKSSISQYSVLKKLNKEKILIPFNSASLTVMYVSIITLASTSESISGKFGIKANIVISALMAIIPFILSFIPAIFTFKQQEASEKSKGPKATLKEALYIAIKDKKILRYVLLMGIFSASWEVSSINQFTAFHTSGGKLLISKVFQYGAIAMLTGSIISMAIGKRISHQSITKAMIFIAAMQVIAVYIIPERLIFAPALIYLAAFIPSTVVINNELQKKLPEGSQSRIYSVVTIISASTTVILNTLFYSLSKYIGYKNSHTVAFGVITLFLIFASRIARK